MESTCGAERSLSSASANSPSLPYLHCVKQAVHSCSCYQIFCVMATFRVPLLGNFWRQGNGHGGRASLCKRFFLICILFCSVVSMLGEKMPSSSVPPCFLPSLVALYKWLVTTLAFVASTPAKGAGRAIVPNAAVCSAVRSPSLPPLQLIHQNRQAILNQFAANPPGGVSMRAGMPQQITPQVNMGGILLSLCFLFP